MVVDDSYVGRLALNGWVWVLVLVGWRYGLKWAYLGVVGVVHILTRVIGHILRGIIGLF